VEDLASPPVRPGGAEEASHLLANSKPRDSPRPPLSPQKEQRRELKRPAFTLPCRFIDLARSGGGRPPLCRWYSTHKNLICLFFPHQPVSTGFPAAASALRSEGAQECSYGWSSAAAQRTAAEPVESTLHGSAPAGAEGASIRAAAHSTTHLSANSKPRDSPRPPLFAPEERGNVATGGAARPRSGPPRNP